MKLNRHGGLCCVKVMWSCVNQYFFDGVCFFLTDCFYYRDATSDRILELDDGLFVLYQNDVAHGC